MTKTIVFCLPGREFSGNFLQCWTHLYNWCINNDIKPILSNRYTSNVYNVREMCLKFDNLGGKYQKPFGGLDYDYIMFIDSDMIYTPQDFSRLLTVLESDSSKDVVSGTYLMQGGVKYPVVLSEDPEYFSRTGQFKFLTKSDISENVKNNNTLLKVFYNGMGFMLMRWGVVERVEFPIFSALFYDYKDVKIQMSEDVSFCKKLQDIEIDVWVNLNVLLGHEKMHILR